MAETLDFTETVASSPLIQEETVGSLVLIIYVLSLPHNRALLLESRFKTSTALVLSPSLISRDSFSQHSKALALRTRFHAAPLDVNAETTPLAPVSASSDETVAVESPSLNW